MISAIHQKMSDYILPGPRIRFLSRPEKDLVFPLKGNNMEQRVTMFFSLPVARASSHFGCMLEEDR